MDLGLSKPVRAIKALAPPFGLRGFGPADVVILALVAGAAGAVVVFAREFEAPFLQAVQIDLRAAAVPKYTLYSLMRGVLALSVSFLFALLFGYAAARSRAAERLLLPVLDILQSIPVLGFLPGLVLGLVALFPYRNVGLELAAIVMIFTAQAWNLALSFYNSLKSLPDSLRDASKMAGWSPARRFRELELPAAAQGLVWNGMLSMAGGWFFLMVNEAFRLGDRDYRLPGIGSYMSVALDQRNVTAMGQAILAMVVMIVAVDQLLWRPLARLPRRAAVLRRRAYRSALRAAGPLQRPLQRPLQFARPVLTLHRRVAFGHPAVVGTGVAALVVAVLAGGGWGLWHLVLLLRQLGPRDWGRLAGASGLTFARVMAAVALSTAWALPVGVLIGRSPRVSQALQPVIQVVASFPAPMLFPIVILSLERVGIGLGIGAVALMVLSGQWYILFNVISAVSAVPEQLKDATAVFRLPALATWRALYVPAAFPALVTGWVTAAGGAWNGSIVAEYIEAGGTLQTTTGLGSLISVATARANYPLLAGGITLMSLIVVGWNRFVWRQMMRLAQSRYTLAQ
ncbi:MAG: ABC transporter permease [Gemmatimonadetes bacterium]|nr:MAG: ABC transporter permease [Gemmatimonadota bacterium]